MNPKLAGQIRHFLTSGGWIVFLVVFLPSEWWDRATENIKKLGNIGTLIGASSGGIALLAHWWSAASKVEPDTTQEPDKPVANPPQNP